jgi:hypothetical protein
VLAAAGFLAPPFLLREPTLPLDAGYGSAENNSSSAEVNMLAYVFVLLAIAVRFLPFAGSLNFVPHAWHFTPLAASLLFFGARGPRRQMWIPLVLMAAADVILTKYIYGIALGWEQLIIWAWYGAILWLGSNLRQKSAFWRVLVAALASSISFFLISNFSAWIAMPQLYARNVSGLIACYVAGIPFLRNTVESDVFFSLAFFGTPVLLHALSERFHRSSGREAAA